MMFINAGMTVTYTPVANFNGTDRFIYTVNDGRTGTAIATVTITVTAVNDAPVAVNDAVSALPDAVKTIFVLTNDSDVDGDTLTITATTMPAHGTVVINTGTTITYTPATGCTGPDIFTYTISAARGDTATATVTLTVSTGTGTGTNPDDDNDDDNEDDEKHERREMRDACN